MKNYQSPVDKITTKFKRKPTPSNELDDEWLVDQELEKEKKRLMEILLRKYRAFYRDLCKDPELGGLKTGSTINLARTSLAFSKSSSYSSSSEQSVVDNENGHLSTSKQKYHVQDQHVSRSIARINQRPSPLSVSRKDDVNMLSDVKTSTSRERPQYAMRKRDNNINKSIDYNRQYPNYSQTRLSNEHHSRSLSNTNPQLLTEQLKDNPNQTVFQHLSTSSSTSEEFKSNVPFTIGTTHTTTIVSVTNNIKPSQSSKKTNIHLLGRNRNFTSYDADEIKEMMKNEGKTPKKEVQDDINSGSESDSSMALYQHKLTHAVEVTEDEIVLRTSQLIIDKFLPKRLRQRQEILNQRRNQIQLPNQNNRLDKHAGISPYKLRTKSEWRNETQKLTKAATLLTKEKYDLSPLTKSAMTELTPNLPEKRVQYRNGKTLYNLSDSTSDEKSSVDLSYVDAFSSNPSNTPRKANLSSLFNSEEDEIFKELEQEGPEIDAEIEATQRELSLLKSRLQISEAVSEATHDVLQHCRDHLPKEMQECIDSALKTHEEVEAAKKILRKHSSSLSSSSSIYDLRQEETTKTRQISRPKSYHAESHRSVESHCHPKTPPHLEMKSVENNYSYKKFADTLPATSSQITNLNQFSPDKQKKKSGFRYAKFFKRDQQNKSKLYPMKPNLDDQFFNLDTPLFPNKQTTIIYSPLAPWRTKQQMRRNQRQRKPDSDKSRRKSKILCSSLACGSRCRRRHHKSATKLSVTSSSLEREELESESSRKYLTIQDRELITGKNYYCDTSSTGQIPDNYQKTSSAECIEEKYHKLNLPSSPSSQHIFNESYFNDEIDEVSQSKLTKEMKQIQHIEKELEEQREILANLEKSYEPKKTYKEEQYIDKKSYRKFEQTIEDRIKKMQNTNNELSWQQIPVETEINDEHSEKYPTEMDASEFETASQFSDVDNLDNKQDFQLISPTEGFAEQKKEQPFIVRQATTKLKETDELNILCTSSDKLNTFQNLDQVSKHKDQDVKQSVTKFENSEQY
ncbi:hypothetical protein SNEBB_006480, partial [Seison nebaliae]